MAAILDCQFYYDKTLNARFLKKEEKTLIMLGIKIRKGMMKFACINKTKQNTKPDGV